MSLPSRALGLGVALLAAFALGGRTQYNCGSGIVTNQPMHGCTDGKVPPYLADPRVGFTQWVVADVQEEFSASGAPQLVAKCPCTQPLSTSTCFSFSFSRGTSELVFYGWNSTDKVTFNLCQFQCTGFDYVGC